MLKADWFVKDSISATVRNLIDAADREYIQQVTEKDFENALLNEIRFLGAFSREQETRAAKYIHDHLDELYEYAKQTEKKMSQRHRRAY